MEYRRPYTITRSRLVTAIALVVLCVLGAALPYFTLAYLDFSSSPTRSTENVFGTISLLNKLSLEYVPAARRVGLDPLDHAFTVMLLGAAMQAVGLVVAIATVAGQFMNEINKFLWWPFLIGGALLVLGPVPVFVSHLMLTADTVDTSVLWGWIPLVAAGVLVVVTALRSRRRLDSYRGL